jgi:hypothetical protein
MDKIFLTEPEKTVLRELCNGNDVRKIDGLTSEVLGQAAKLLKEKEFVRAVVNYGKLLDIAIEPKGKAYLELYPNLDNPVYVDIEQLQKDYLQLRNDELRYKKKVRVWKIIAAILGLGDLIWLLFSLFKC